MWTRFFPLVQALRALVRNGEIGSPSAVQATFGFNCPTDVQRMYDPAFGGGALLDIGCYTIQAAMLAFGQRMPKVKAMGSLVNGVDACGAIALGYPTGQATLHFSIQTWMPEEVRICGTKGWIEIDSPAHAPQSFTVHRREDRGGTSEERVEYALPEARGSEFNYPNSQGLIHEVKHVQALVEAGKCESDLFPHAESLVLARIMDEVRRQVGVRYASDRFPQRSRYALVGGAILLGACLIWRQRL